MIDLLPLLAEQRRALADVLDSLDAEAWAHPSLCDGWTVRDVTAHLVYLLEHSTLATVATFVRHRGDFDRMTRATVAADPRRGPELAAALRAHAMSRNSPPGFGLEAPLTDVVVHAQDICRPLSIAHPLDATAARPVLDLIVAPKARRAFVAKGRLDGLRLEATDCNWAHGTGADVRGAAVDIALGALGRTPALTELRGAGVELLAARLAH